MFSEPTASPADSAVDEGGRVERPMKSASPRRRRGTVPVDVRLVPAPGRWTGTGACAEVDPETFFPVAEDSAGAAPAKKVCAGCTVREQCLAYALATGMGAGVWGGLTTVEREVLIRSRSPR